MIDLTAPSMDPHFFFERQRKISLKEKQSYKEHKTKENTKEEVLEKCTTTDPTYIIAPTQGSNLSTPCLANTFAMELADLISRRKETLILTDNL